MRCPVCKAEAQGPQCRRCKADLSLLFRLEEERARVFSQAADSLARGQWQEARARAARVHWLRRAEDSARLLAITHLLTRDFPRAWQLYQVMREDKAPG